jgi:hypothetical protein
MDSSALFGLIGALLGSLVGAAGSYWATVGGSQAQSRRRLGTAYRAISARLQGEQGSEASDRGRLTTLRSQLQGILDVLAAAAQGQAGQFPGAAVGATLNSQAADAPGGRRWLRQLLTSFGLPGQLPSSWLGAIAPDVGQMDPLLYNALSAYEDVLDLYIRFVNDTVPDLLTFTTELQEPDDLSLQDVARQGQLARTVRQLATRVAVLMDMHATLTQVRAEVLRLLPTATRT